MLYTLPQYKSLKHESGVFDPNSYNDLYSSKGISSLGLPSVFFPILGLHGTNTFAVYSFEDWLIASVRLILNLTLALVGIPLFGFDIGMILPSSSVPTLSRFIGMA